ncbi:MAG TPA: response regulator [Paucimonas sp.]|nr:response regulator [Paucimonas sp.]
MNAFRKFRLSSRLAILIALFSAGFAAYGVWSFKTLDQLKVNGPLYQRIIQGKDLIADVLPPPGYIIESYLLSLQLAATDERHKQEALIQRLKILKGEYDERYVYWNKQQDLDNTLYELQQKHAHVPAASFYAIAFDEFVPAVRRADKDATASALRRMSAAYEEHRQSIDKIVRLARERAAGDEQEGKRLIQSASLLMLLILAGSLGASVAAAALITRSITRPLDEAVRVAKVIASGDLSSRIDTQFQDEPGQLLRALKEMNDSLARLFAEQQAHAKGLADEIAERKRIEADLRTSTARFTAMDEASPLGTFVTDENGCCQHVNQAYQKITRYSQEEMQGRPWHAGIHPDDKESVLAQWREASEHGTTFSVESRFQRSDGSETWVSCKAAAMRDGERFLGWVGTLEDISERKQVERMKSEFVSTVSHELRTPLTSIMGSLGLLTGGVSGELSAQAKMLIEIAHKNSERLVRLINDILDIEKISSGRMQFDLQPHALQPLVEQAIAANRAYAAQFDVNFVLVAPLPGAQVRVDSDRLMQVMTNLMGNAAKFSPRGASVELRIERRGGVLRFSVSDSGPGIPTAFRSKVFQQFSQADSSDTRQKGGTGLGLSISKAIVEAMGGEIGFISVGGQGSTFYFDLPEWRADVAAPAVEPAACPDAPALVKVLVCEDDRDVAKLICMILEQAGYGTVAAYDAESARRLLAAGGIAAMTLDIHLPDVDGREFLRQLRADPATAHLPIVVVSGFLRTHPRAAEGDVGNVVDWIPKPIDVERLLNALRHGPERTADGGSEERGKSRVLHVEDDADVRQVVASLCGEVADIESAASVREAEVLLAARRYDLIILDLLLPDRSGWDLMPVIDRQRPRPPVLVFSGKEISSEESGKVAAALVKSHASNPELLDVIRTLTAKA